MVQIKPVKSLGFFFSSSTEVSGEKTWTSSFADTQLCSAFSNWSASTVDRWYVKQQIKIKLNVLATIAKAFCNDFLKTYIENIDTTTVEVIGMPLVTALLLKHSLNSLHYYTVLRIGKSNKIQVNKSAFVLKEVNFYDIEYTRKKIKFIWEKTMVTKKKKFKNWAIWKHKTDNWSSTMWNEGNLGQRVFRPVLDHNKSLPTPVHLNVILVSLLKY